MPGQEWVQAIVTVGGGKGFVVEIDRQRLIVTAGHCLPQLPPSFPGSYIEERTFVKLVRRTEKSLLYRRNVCSSTR
jgi:hypothetical protein